MTERLHFTEFEPVALGRTQREAVTAGMRTVTSTLAPTLQQIELDNDSVTLSNVVGSFLLPDGGIVEVAPKVLTGDWTTAVIHLLSKDTRLVVAGSHRSTPSQRRDDLSAALALEYARRLERAVRREGPLEVYERKQHRSRRWSGQLEMTKWLRTVSLDPSRFPMSRDELSVINDFTRGLAIVAGALGRSAAGGELSTHLRRLQSQLVAGGPTPVYVNPAVARRRLPPQWAAYAPAWDIASALLRNQSVVGDPGRATGLEVAVEPWRLLETLLERALRAVAALPLGVALVPKRAHSLLIDASSRRRTQAVEPDGLLCWSDGRVAATFEAKYSDTASPRREHVFQALSTAAALESPVSVLVYPGDFETKIHEVVGFNGQPARLVTLGARMYDYRRGVGDTERAGWLAHVISPVAQRELS